MLIFWLLTIIMLLVLLFHGFLPPKSAISRQPHYHSPPGPMFNSPLFLTHFLLQEFGDSARARRLYADDDDDEEEQELEPNPKLSQGESNGLTSVGRQCCNEMGFYPFKCYLFAKAAPCYIPLAEWCMVNGLCSVSQSVCSPGGRVVWSLDSWTVDTNIELQAMICLAAMESSLSSSPVHPSATLTRTTRTRRPSLSSAKGAPSLGKWQRRSKAVNHKCIFSDFLLRVPYICYHPFTRLEGKPFPIIVSSADLYRPRIAIHVLTHPLFSFAIICTILVNCYVMVEPDTE